MPVPVSGVLRFDGFQIDRAQWQLRYGDDVLPLNRKTFDLLLYLAEHADRVVTKDELMQVLWPEQFIEESNLTQQVFLLRRALGRGASGNKFIETVPGRGYRFAVPVRFEPRRETPVELQEHVADPATHRSHESTQPQGADPGAHLADPSHGTGQSATASGALPRNEQPLRYEPGLFKTKFLVWSLALVLAGLSLAYVLTRPNQSAPLSISAYTQ
ncbi:MAG TPA: transcriptional regulator, partial [Acidobacteriaceae bacterium]|nr:transcriptional regulator [Acidobacteriaceae bacterium]